MITRADHDTWCLLGIEVLQDGRKGFVVGQNLVYLGHRIVCMTSMINPAPFHHQEEALIVVLRRQRKGSQRCLGHLVQ